MTEDTKKIVDSQITNEKKQPEKYVYCLYQREDYHQFKVTSYTNLIETVNTHCTKASKNISTTQLSNDYRNQLEYIKNYKKGESEFNYLKRMCYELMVLFPEINDENKKNFLDTYNNILKSAALVGLHMAINKFFFDEDYVIPEDIVKGYQDNYKYYFKANIFKDCVDGYYRTCTDISFKGLEKKEPNPRYNEIRDEITEIRNILNIRKTNTELKKKLFILNHKLKLAKKYVDINNKDEKVKDWKPCDHAYYVYRVKRHLLNYTSIWQLEQILKYIFQIQKPDKVAENKLVEDIRQEERKIKSRVSENGKTLNENNIEKIANWISLNGSERGKQTQLIMEGIIPKATVKRNWKKAIAFLNEK